MATGVNVLAVPDSVLTVSKTTAVAGATSYTVPADRFAVITVSLHGQVTGASYFGITATPITNRMISRIINPGAVPKLIPESRGSYTFPPGTIVSIVDDVGDMLIELYKLPGSNT